jgi:hypothetical protein
MKVLFAGLSVLLPAFVGADLMADKLVFSEILPIPTGGDRGQFIEIFNPTGAAVDLSGYELCSSSNCTALVGIFPASTYYTLCSDISQYAYCNVGTKIDLAQLGGESGDSLTLKDPEGNVVDSAMWMNATEGMSYVRGLNEADMLEFSWTADHVPGSGFLGEVTPTAPPVTAAPVDPPTGAPITLSPTVAPVTPNPTTASPTKAPITPQPTDLCATAFCHKRADCIIEGSKATCRCKTGFAGDGQFVCNDVDGTLKRFVSAICSIFGAFFVQISLTHSFFPQNAFLFHAPKPASASTTLVPLPAVVLLATKEMERPVPTSMSACFLLALRVLSAQTRQAHSSAPALKALS